jgi:hypothetical protein
MGRFDWQRDLPHEGYKEPARSEPAVSGGLASGAPAAREEAKPTKESAARACQTAPCSLVLRDPVDPRIDHICVRASLSRKWSEELKGGSIWDLKLLHENNRTGTLPDNLSLVRERGVTRFTPLDNQRDRGCVGTRQCVRCRDPKGNPVANPKRYIGSRSKRGYFDGVLRSAGDLRTSSRFLPLTAPSRYREGQERSENRFTPHVIPFRTTSLAALSPSGRRVSGERRAEGDERVCCTSMLGGAFLLPGPDHEIDTPRYQLVGTCRRDRNQDAPYEGGTSE